jgi:hypothetical protein
MLNYSFFIMHFTVGIHYYFFPLSQKKLPRGKQRKCEILLDRKYNYRRSVICCDEQRGRQKLFRRLNGSEIVTENFGKGKWQNINLSAQCSELFALTTNVLMLFCAIASAAISPGSVGRGKGERVAARQYFICARCVASLMSLGK